MIATVLFTYDEFCRNEQPTEQQIYDHILQWKPRWKGIRDQEIQNTICELSALGWMMPRQDVGLLSNDDLF